MTEEELPEFIQRELKLLERQIWKKGMHASPHYGGIWSLYHKVGDLLAFGEISGGHFPQRYYFRHALKLGYEPALQICESNLVGQHAMRKKINSLLKIAMAKAL